MFQNSLSFCFSIKVFISSSNMNDSLDRRVFLVCFCFCFHHFEYIFQLPYVLQNFCWKPNSPLYGNSLVHNVLLLIVSNFCHLIAIYLGMHLFELILFRALCVSWTYVSFSFPTLGKFSAIMSLNMFFAPPSLSLLLLKSL